MNYPYGSLDCIVYLFVLPKPTTEHLDAGVLYPSIIRAAAAPPAEQRRGPRPIIKAPSVQHRPTQRSSAEAQQIEQWDAGGGVPHPGTTRAATALLTGQC